MASSLADAKLMADIVEKNNLIGRVEFHKRYDLSNLIAREKIQNGCLGRLQYAYVHYSQRHSLMSFLLGVLQQCFAIFRCSLHRSNSLDDQFYL